MDKKEMQIISQFRNNARQNLTRASRKMRIPISTIYDRLKKYEGTLITKYTSLVNFGKLGYNIKMHIALKASMQTRTELLSFLQNHPRVNSLYTISNGYDFLIEVVLKNLQEVADFGMALDRIGIVNRQDFYIVEDLRREDFLTDPSTIELPVAMEK